MNETKKPLGYMTLINNTRKAIYPLNDFFINYTFYKKENWGHLRNLINIFLDAYAEKYNRQDGFHFINGDVVVETQYEYYITGETKQPTQDIKIDETENKGRTFVEFQNKSRTNPPIAIRASNYSGLAINEVQDDTKVSQIWLLAENDDDLLLRQAISNYRTREENTGAYYPRDLNIMFISLPRLAEENNIYGELSKLLMGMEVEELSIELKQIAEMFQREFENFKEDKEAVKRMTVLEEKMEEAKLEGRAEGIAIGESRALDNLIRNRIARGDSIEQLQMFAAEIGVSFERLDELLKES